MKNEEKNMVSNKNEQSGILHKKLCIKTQTREKLLRGEQPKNFTPLENEFCGRI